jgi:hypothetical protein
MRAVRLAAGSAPFDRFTFKRRARDFPIFLSTHEAEYG